MHPLLQARFAQGLREHGLLFQAFSSRPEIRVESVSIGSVDDNVQLSPNIALYIVAEGLWKVVPGLTHASLALIQCAHDFV